MTQFNKAAHQRPPLCEEGHVVVVTTYPAFSGGSTVLMRNLLEQFDPRSFTVATIRASLGFKLGHDAEVQTQYVLSMPGWMRGLAPRWLDLQIPVASRRLASIIRQTEAVALVGTYPTYHTLRVARNAAAMVGVPWIAYLHDTLAEGLEGTRLASKAKRLQEQVFAEANLILVMSEGMSNLYSGKYGIATEPLPHSYLEEIPNEPPPGTLPLREAFWGGRVYNINARSVARISRALGRLECPFRLATNVEPEALKTMGVEGNHLHFSFFKERSVYLRALQRHGLLVLGLDWPDESPVHEDELATIFPTKTPEYLASGRPIIVHCPEHYFLARFFREHGCGVVVSQRSVDSIEQACQKLLDVGKIDTHMQESAFRAAMHFEGGRVADRFRSAVESVV